MTTQEDRKMVEAVTTVFPEHYDYRCRAGHTWRLAKYDLVRLFFAGADGADMIATGPLCPYCIRDMLDEACGHVEVVKATVDDDKLKNEGEQDNDES